MGRREIFAGNWKMYKTSSEAMSLIKELIDGLGDIGNREVAVFPPALYTREIVKESAGKGIDVGVQDMYFEEEGAFTGQLSPKMVKDTGCKYILIGHSERRHVFGETNGDVNKKMVAAIAEGIEPMLCIGELLDEREKGITDKVIEAQLTEALKGISSEQAKKVVLAYEPVWAIGTGKVATPEIAEEVHIKIRNIIKSLYNSEISEIMPILYGGSVKPDNISGLFEKENVDGALVGGASLKSASFLDIIHVK